MIVGWVSEADLALGRTVLIPRVTQRSRDGVLGYARNLRAVKIDLPKGLANPTYVDGGV
jgi:hypothetical protein